MMTSGRERQIWADNAKFVGIVLVVFAHVPTEDVAVRSAIYAFHIPLFFMLSGYFADTKTSSFGAYAMKNVKALLVPYLFFQIITLPIFFVLCYRHDPAAMVKSVVGIVTYSDTAVSLMPNVPMWFVPTLFVVRMLFWVNGKTGYSLPMLMVHVIVATAAYLVLAHSEVQGIEVLHVSSILMVYPFFIFGFMCRRYGVMEWIVSRKKAWQVVMGCLSMVVCMVLHYFNTGFEHRMDTCGAVYHNSYVSTVCSAVLGSLSVMIMGNVMPRNGVVLRYGQNTLTVLCLHIPLFHSINLLKPSGMAIDNVLALVYTGVIMAVLYPVILLLDRYCPTLIGKVHGNKQ